MMYMLCTAQINP